jgi:CubicO group peptidase (beta-lactamase class C family)
MGMLALALLLAPAMATAMPTPHRRHGRIEDGPGAGPWERRTPEELGLDGPALDAAEEYLNEEMGGRQCFMVVKDGYIVKEAYRLGHTESSVRSAASVTKSLCSLMYGMAVEQGWANVEDLVRERNSGNTRQCAADADFRHVLTMTGRSIDPPLFQYDASGTACLDTVADFFAQNNPQGLDPNEWKDRFFREALGEAEKHAPLFSYKDFKNILPRQARDKHRQS